MPPGGQRTIGRHVVISLCAACTGCITRALQVRRSASSLPRRCLHGVHPTAVGTITDERDFASALPARGASRGHYSTRPLTTLCLGAACTGCIRQNVVHRQGDARLCLGAACTGCIEHMDTGEYVMINFASALPARGASRRSRAYRCIRPLCLGAACTGCIGSGELGITLTSTFASALPARGASRLLPLQGFPLGALPRRCLHGVHRARRI